jgi:hypothetical protein
MHYSLNSNHAFFSPSQSCVPFTSKSCILLSIPVMRSPLNPSHAFFSPACLVMYSFLPHSHAFFSPFQSYLFFLTSLSLIFPFNYVQNSVLLYPVSVFPSFLHLINLDFRTFSLFVFCYQLSPSILSICLLSLHCKPFEGPKNRFPAGQAGTTTLFDVPARQCWHFRTIYGG